jgi:hypothetical protein
MPLRVRDLYILLVFLGLTHLFYFPTWNAGFVTDFTGMIWRMEGKHAFDILGSFGFPALQPVLSAFQYLFYQAFGLSPWPWYLVFTSLHVLNGFLVYRLGASLLEAYGSKTPRLAALLGAVFFLLLPYQSEVVVWRVCFNYQLSSFLLLSVLWLAQAWLKEGRARLLWLAHLLFVMALFTFQLAITLPLAGLALVLLFPKEARQGQIARAFWRLSLPQFGLLGGYLLLNRVILGSWVGYYGAEAHLSFPLKDILANYFNYAIKLLAFSRDWPHPWKEGLTGWLQQPMLIYPLSVAAALGLLFAFARYRRWRGEVQASLLFLLLFALALAPVSNLFFYYLQHLENDRYSYLPSAFFLLGLSSLLSILPRRLYLLLAAVYLGFAALFLWRTNQYWKESTALYHRLLDGFEWHDAPAVYLLNLPANYQGALLFRDFAGQGDAFRDALRYVKQQPYEGAIYEIAQYNLAKPGDGVSVRVDSTHHLTVEFNQWGNWWWRRGIGMGPGYQAEGYSVQSKGQFYHLTLDTIVPGAVFLYQNADGWQVADFPPADVRLEQPDEGG